MTSSNVINKKTLDQINEDEENEEEHSDGNDNKFGGGD
jgi:hypothetical protein